MGGSWHACPPVHPPLQLPYTTDFFHSGILVYSPINCFNFLKSLRSCPIMPSIVSRCFLPSTGAVLTAAAAHNAAAPHC